MLIDILIFRISHDELVVELNRVSKERDLLAARIKDDAKCFEETIQSTRQKRECNETLDLLVNYAN